MLLDVGGSEHWVAISPDRDPEPVRRFGCFTVDLREMARWLIDKGVRSVALQSTGVYWMPVFEVLEQHGLEVFLVNAQHTKKRAKKSRGMLPNSTCAASYTALPALTGHKFMASMF